jgi:hypothetical protein
MLLRHTIIFLFIEAIETTKAKQCIIIIGNNKLYVVVLIIKIGKDPTWYINIGVIQHMAHEKNTFISYEVLNTSQVVT